MEPLFERAAWFLGLDDAQKGLVRATAVEREFLAGAYIARANKPSSHWFGVASGFLHMSVTAQDGTETTLHFLRPGEWGGEGSLLKRELRRYDLVAVQASRVCVLPQATFDLLYAQSLPFNHFLIGNFNERMGVVTALLEASRLLRPEDRVAQCLRLLATREGTTSLTIAQHQLASVCGLSRQRTNQALQMLRKDAVIHIDGQTIRLREAARPSQH